MYLVNLLALAIVVIGTAALRERRLHSTLRSSGDWGQTLICDYGALLITNQGDPMFEHSNQ